MWIKYQELLCITTESYDILTAKYNSVITSTLSVTFLYILTFVRGAVSVYKMSTLLSKLHQKHQLLLFSPPIIELLLYVKLKKIILNISFDASPVFFYNNVISNNTNRPWRYVAGMWCPHTQTNLHSLNIPKQREGYTLTQWPPVEFLAYKATLLLLPHHILTHRFFFPHSFFYITSYMIFLISLLIS